jgi:hypothetical protein
MRKALLFLATTALLGVAAAPASAESHVAQSLVQLENGNCGHYIVGGPPIIGTSKFTRIVNKMTVAYKVKHFAKLSKYELELWNATGGACQLLGTIASGVTTSTGALSLSGSMEVPAADYEFFSDAVNTEGKLPFSGDSLISIVP